MPYESWIEKSFYDRGFAEGRAEARAEFLEIAKKFLADGTSPDTVAYAMQLTPEELQLITSDQH